MYFCQIPTDTRMRAVKFLLPFLLLIPAFISCNKDLNVDASWKDITVVYGLLDQSADTTFIKVTKAFLGPGDALTFAKIADSSIYPNTLEVRLDEFNGTSFIKSYPCDTITLHNKQKGDSIFYYPNQLMYYSKVVLNENYTYKLYIKNKKTGKEITGQTTMIHDFQVYRPQMNVSFVPNEYFEVRWDPAKNTARYQVLIRFYYQEWLTKDPANKHLRSIDWVAIPSLKIVDQNSTQQLDRFISGDGFYNVVGALIDTTSVLTRYADHCVFIFSCASADLNTYMEVTEPSMTIVQEKPAFTNIVNGIGLFSSRYTKKIDSLGIRGNTRSNLKINPSTIHRGF